MSDLKTTGISRRSILKTVGAGAAALATTPIISKAEAIKLAALSQTSSMKAGIIIPGFAAKANSSAFLNGIDLFITTYGKEQGNAPFTPVVETASGRSLVSAFSKLTQQHDVKLVVGYTNSRTTHQLTAAIEEAQLPFIEANLGENVFTSDSKFSFHSSLNLWQAHYLLGKYAAEHSGKRAISVGSFYDAAYDAHYAFEAGFVAGGGTVVHQITTGSPADHFSPIEAASQAATSDAEVVFINYSGTDASIFASAIQRSEGISSKKLYGSSLLSNPLNTSFISSSADGIITASSGIATVSTTEFASAYKAAYRSAASDLALLGYQTAQLVTAAIATAGKKASGQKLASSLAALSFETPRGVVAMNATTHATEAPVTIFTIGGEVISQESMPMLANLGLDTTLRSGALNLYPFAS
jgi:ABC-type branched-subunit amino acid transport system substrate-binding protein